MMFRSLRYPPSALLRTILVGLLGVCIASCSGPVVERVADPRPAVSSTGGLVAADHPLAAEAGAEILRSGGNAVDAAVATSLALSVVRPDACGIGGGGFMVIRLNDDPEHGDLTIAINYRETSPAAIGPETYAASDDPEASRRGGRAVAVPGTIAGLLHALERFGTLDRRAVFAPAIRLAEDGFLADEHHVRTARSLLSYFEDDPSRTERFPMVWERLMLRGEVRVGDPITLPDQARALRLIAENGADAFYRGPIADAIVESVAADRGVLTPEDLAGYRVHEVQPVTHRIGGLSVVAMPPPSSGGVAVAQLLDLAERLGLAIPPSGLLEPETAHALAECMKHVFADRSRYMADPRFHDVPVASMLDASSLEAVAESVRRAVERSQTAEPASYGVLRPVEDDGGTSHISVIDRFGNAVACTETINLAFGSLVGVRNYGFCLNNQMDDFTTVSGQTNAFGLMQSDANLPEPGKRPLSSMSPTIVLDQRGEVIAVAGASGGPRIITSTAQVLLRHLLGGATAEQAVTAPRLHHQWAPERLELEPGGTAALSDALSGMGHETASRDRIGAVQAIFRNPDTGVVSGAADPRKGGSVAGD